LTTPRRHHATAVVGNYLYVLGGDESGSVERAAIQADGSLGAFSQVIGRSLRAPRTSHTTTALQDQLYVFGGSGSSGSSIERATMNADGSLGPFAVIDNITLRIGRAQHASAIVGDYLYILGGSSPDSLELSSVERADVHNGLTSFDIVPGVTITATRGLTSAVVGQSLYVLGGSPSIAERAIVSGRSLGPFGPSTGGELATRRFFPATVVLKNYVYVLGGIFGRAEVSSVEAALLR
jgi:N-acetylneuraminic acid mutarotase